MLLKKMCTGYEYNNIHSIEIKENGKRREVNTLI